MKLTFTKQVLLLGALVLFPAVQALAQVYLTPQIRPRAEWRNGYQTLPSEHSKGAFFIGQRSRLSLDYKHEKIAMKFSLQDVRVWGDEVQLKDVPSAAIHEAWGEMALSENLSIRLGRQEFVYNEDRLLGNVDWVQQARSHDAILIKTRLENLSFDVGAAFNQEKEQTFGTFYGMSNYKALGFAWLRKQLHDNLTLSGMYVGDGFQRPDTVGGVYFRHTYGLDLTYKKDRMQVNSAFYRQSGEHASGRNIEGYLGVAEAIYSLQPVRFTIGTNYLSGMAGGESKVRSFNTLYATNHKFYGYMDYFINIPVDTRNGGLQDNYLKVGYTPAPKYTISLDYHYFALAQNLKPTETQAGTNSKYLGSEIDAVLHYKHSEHINIFLGYSTLFAGNSMEAIKPGNASAYANWGWLMVNIQPKLLLKSFDKD